MDGTPVMRCAKLIRNQRIPDIFSITAQTAPVSSVGLAAVASATPELTDTDVGPVQTPRLLPGVPGSSRKPAQRHVMLDRVLPAQRVRDRQPNGLGAHAGERELEL